MPSGKTWRIQIGGQAASDFTHILSWTEDKFGTRQAHAYGALLRSALQTLARDPLAPPSRTRDDDVGVGFRTLHLIRPGRHLLLYRVEAERILIVRILHDSMELSRHLLEAEYSSRHPPPSSRGAPRKPTQVLKAAPLHVTRRFGVCE